MAIPPFQNKNSPGTPPPLLIFASYVLPLLLLVFIGLYLSTSHQSSDLFNTYLWVLAILGPVAIAVALALLFPVFATQGGFFGLTITMVLVTLGIVIAYDYSRNYSALLNRIAGYSTLALIVLVGLALLFSVLKSYTKDRGWTGFWMKLFFYLPCLLVDAITGWMQDLRMTPRPTLLLLVAEILLILMYVYGPTWYTQLRSLGGPSSSTVLQATPVFLHTKKETILATNSQIALPTPAPGQLANPSPYRQQYSLTVWVSINPDSTPPPGEEVNILYYASKSVDNQNQWVYRHPKPRVTYTRDPTTHQEAFRIYVSDSLQTPPYHLQIGNQAWHQLVFVYAADHLDLYVNGHLEKTWAKSEGITSTYTPHDMIVIGDDQHTLYGAVGKVVYDDHPLTVGEVANSWNIDRLRAMNGFA